MNKTENKTKNTTGNKTIYIPNKQPITYKKSPLYMKFINILTKMRRIRIYTILLLLVASFFSFKKYYPGVHVFIKSLLKISGEIFLIAASLIVTIIFWPSKHKNSTEKKTSLHLSYAEIKIIFIFGIINLLRYIIQYGPLSIKIRNPFKKKIGTGTGINKEKNIKENKDGIKPNNNL